jgi:hypothetical protein
MTIDLRIVDFENEEETNLAQMWDVTPSVFNMVISFGFQKRRRIPSLLSNYQHLDIVMCAESYLFQKHKHLSILI